MSESSDRELLDLIRRCGPLTVVEMGAQSGGDGDGGPEPFGEAARDGAGRAKGRAPGAWASTPHLRGQRPGAEAARAELCRPGRRALG